MLGKLVKQEWRTSWKVPVLFVIVLMVCTIIAGLTTTAPIWNTQWDGLSLMGMMLLLMYYFAIIVCSVGILVYLVVRFYRSMFTDEGYLTHTLPVTARQTLLSKIITMSLWELLSMLATFASIAIFIGFLMFSSGDTEMVRNALQDSQMEGVGGFAISIIVMSLSSCFSSVMILAGSVCLGQMIQKHRVLGAVGAYFAINTVLQIISFVVLLPFFLKLIEAEAAGGGEFSIFGFYTPVYLILSAIMLVVGIILYFVSEHLVQKKLELE